MCFDDSDLVDEEGLDLTTISCDPVAMGLSAADVFLQRQDNLLGRRFRIVYSPSLKERSSVRNIAENKNGCKTTVFCASARSADRRI